MINDYKAKTPDCVACVQEDLVWNTAVQMARQQTLHAVQDWPPVSGREGELHKVETVEPVEDISSTQ